MGFIFTLILFALTLILSEVFKPKVASEAQRPASLGDFKFPTAIEGRPVPLIWGTVKIDGPNVVWWGDLRVRPIKQKIKSGMFSSKKVIVGFNYDVGTQLALCRGPVDEILRVWWGDDLVFDAVTPLIDSGSDVVIDEPELLGGEKGQGGIGGTFRVHPGSETQPPSPYLSQFQQQGGDTPAYVGTCYMAPATAPFHVGTSTTIKPIKIELRRIPRQLSPTNALVNGTDANPAHVLFEILTNSEWGLRFPVGDIEVSTFTTAAASLVSEGNGFSFVLDNQRPLQELVRELERQIDGLVVQNRVTGKWELKLIRADFVVGNIPEINTGNILELKDFRRASWSDTSNHVRVKFSDRARDYFETYASAQDMANVRIQNANVIADQFYPGIKDRALANNIAWRELRLLSRPLAKATLVVDRTFFAVTPGDPLRWTDPDLEFTNLVMRITSVDLGELDQGRIELQLIEDVFAIDAGVFGVPQDSGWVPPSDTLVPIPLADHAAFEAPRAFITRGEGVNAPTIWVGWLHQGDSAVDADIFEAGTDAGDVAGPLLAGELLNDLSAGTSQGNTGVLVVPNPSSQIELFQGLGSGFSTADIGQSLAGIVLIGEEFLGFRTFAITGSNITISGGFRGLMDTAPANHPAGTRVWFLFVNGNLLERTVPTGSRTIEVLTSGLVAQLTAAQATNVPVFVTGTRHLQPYPPVDLNINGTVFPTGTVSLDVVSGGGINDNRGLILDWIRRDWRTTDETLAVLSEATLPSDYPTANTTEHQILVVNDPDGAATLLFTVPWLSSDGVVIFVSRTKILRETDGVIPSRMRLRVQTRHTVESQVITATQELTWDFNAASNALAGSQNLGFLTNLEISPIYLAPVDGDYGFTIGAALASGSVEARINGGSWVAVITSGNTTGTLLGVITGDTIEVRPNNAIISDRDETLLTIDAPGSTDDAYAILLTT